MNTRPLDHYYLKLHDGSLAVVSGNWHVDCCIVGFVKYRPCNRPTLWANDLTFYERLVKVYNAIEIRKYTPWSLYVPFFDSSIPCIPSALIAEMLDPVERSQEIISRVSDGLEKVATEIVLDVLSSTGIMVGITGSVLPRIHNPECSDADFIVYGPRNSLKVVEYLSNNQQSYKPLSGERLSNWTRNVSATTGLPPKEAIKFYRNWRRGVYREREYSFAYSDGIYRDLMLMPAFKTLGTIRAVVEVYGGVEALNYPAQARILSFKPIESSATFPFDISHVLSYEALYTAALYEGGLFEVNGLVQCSNNLETCRIILGVHEYYGSMRYRG